MAAAAEEREALEREVAVLEQVRAGVLHDLELARIRGARPRGLAWGIAVGVVLVGGFLGLMALYVLASVFRMD